MCRTYIEAFWMGSRPDGATTRRIDIQLPYIIDVRHIHDIHVLGIIAIT